MMSFWVNSSKEFGSSSHNIFVSKLGPCSLKKSSYMARLRVVVNWSQFTWSKMWGTT